MSYEEKQAIDKRNAPDVLSQDRASELSDPIDPEAERRLRWKCDIHVLPMLCIMYLLSFLDRVNIGNARIEGLEKELHMKGHDYNVALFVFFVSSITPFSQSRRLRSAPDSRYHTFCSKCQAISFSRMLILPPILALSCSSGES